MHNYFTISKYIVRSPLQPYRCTKYHTVATIIFIKHAKNKFKILHEIYETFSLCYRLLLASIFLRRINLNNQRNSLLFGIEDPV